jgi:thiosulfate/3-mercaptopyruvate sulfurtransferase
MVSIGNTCRAAVAVVAILGMVGIGVGCGGSERSAAAGSAGSNETASAERLSPPAVIVEQQWVHEHLGDERLVVIDARGPEAYATGHIPGAINLSPLLLLDKKSENDTNMAAIGEIERVFGDAGIDSSRAVVIYDGEDYRPAARIFWVLEVHGQQRVAVLNGGIQGWTAAGYPLATQAATARKTRFIANLQPERYVTKLDVFKSIDREGVAILDSRSEPEYEGSVPVFGQRGHIKRAINIDFMKNLNLGGDGVCNIRYSEELKNVYRDELKGRDKIIAYCNTGTHASVSYLILRSLGYPVAVYDGSWKEWSSDSRMPTEVAFERKP